MRQGNKTTLTRRGFMRSSAAAATVLAAPAILKGTRAFAGQSLIVRDWGGTYTEGFK
ncbi:ABC transporter substrate-binding protein, partial [Thioclava sp. BHET1]